MNQPLELVTLRTGAEVPRVMVNVILISLSSLFETDPIALYELVMLARDPHHQPWGNTGLKFEQLALTKGGRLHDTTRDIVVAAVEGEEFEMHLVNPIRS